MTAVPASMRRDGHPYWTEYSTVRIVAPCPGCGRYVTWTGCRTPNISGPGTTYRIHCPHCPTDDAEGSR